MTSFILAFALLALPMTTHAANHGAAKASSGLSPTETKVITRFEHEIAEMTTAFSKTQECFETEKSLQKSLTAKKAELAREFGGAIPLAFSDLLWKKKLRIDRQHQACVQIYSQLGMAFSALDTDFGGYEPKTLDVSRLRAKVDAQKIKYRQLLPPAKAPGKTPKNDAQE